MRGQSAVQATRLWSLLNWNLWIKLKPFSAAWPRRQNQSASINKTILHPPATQAPASERRKVKANFSWCLDGSGLWLGALGVTIPVFVWHKPFLSFPSNFFQNRITKMTFEHYCKMLDLKILVLFTLKSITASWIEHSAMNCFVGSHLYSQLISGLRPPKLFLRMSPQDTNLHSTATEN